MALKNIFREPAREITETVVGLVVVSALSWADYAFASWLRDTAGRTSDGLYRVSIVEGMGGGFMLLLCGFFALLFIHATGEVICGMLQTMHIHLRPLKRRKK